MSENEHRMWRRDLQLLAGGLLLVAIIGMLFGGVLQNFPNIPHTVLAAAETATPVPTDTPTPVPPTATPTTPVIMNTPAAVSILTVTSTSPTIVCDGHAVVTITVTNTGMEAVAWQANYDTSPGIWALHPRDSGGAGNPYLPPGESQTMQIFPVAASGISDTITVYQKNGPYLGAVAGSVTITCQ